MPLPTSIKSALDTLWDEIQLSPNRDFVLTKITVGARTYKVRFYKYNNNVNNELDYKIEIIRKN